MANSDADFLLSVGINPETSLSGMRQGIREIVKSLDANPPKIKVEFDIDQASVTRLRSQIESMLESGGLGGKTTHTDNLSFTQTATNAQKAADEISKLKAETNSLGTAVDRTSKRLETMADKLRDIRNPKSGGAAISETVKQLTDLTARIKEISGTNSGLSKQYYALKGALGGENATGQNATDVELLKNKYLELTNAVELLRTKKATAAQEDIQQIYTLQGELGGLIAKTRERIATEQEASIVAKNEADNIAKTEAKRQSVLKSIITLLGQVERAERNWTAAQSGNSSESYKNIQEIVTLLRRYKNALLSVSADSPEFKQQIDKIDDSIKKLGADFKENENVIRRNDEATRSFTERVGSLAKKFGQWFSITRVIMAAYRAMRQMVSASVEVDDAMTQLKIVTKDTDEAYEHFGDTVAKTAKKIGSSIIDLLDSATVYARLGYTLEESSMLAEYTAMLQNVGDIDVSAAQDAITSIVKAFDVNVNDIESVMDKLVVTGNNFPISVSQIAEGMTNASSALSAAGNTFEQSVALLTAANTTLQNAAKSSTGLRTIAARIRNTKTELDELGEEMSEASYEKLVQQLTDFNVALTTANGEYRSTYDIMSDIAKQWNSMTSMEQAALATAMSGTRQQAVFYSIIEQFQEASGAMDAMADSAGELQKSYDIYLESTTAHINQFKVAFQKLGSDTFDSDFLNQFIDLGTVLIGILDGIINVVNALGGLNTVLFVTAGLIATIKAEALIGILKKLFSPIISLTALLQALSTNEVLTAREGKGLSRTFTILAGSADTAALSISAAQIAIGSLVTVLGIALLAISKYKQNIEESAASARESAEESKKYADSLIALRSEIDSNNKSLAESYDAFKQQLISMGKAEEEVDVLIRKYGGLKEAIRATTKEQLNNAKTEAFKNVDAAGKLLENSEGFGWNNTSSGYNKDGLKTGFDDVLQKKLNDLMNSSNLYKIEDHFGQARGYRYYDHTTISALSHSAEDIYKYYKGISEIIAVIDEYASQNNKSEYFDNDLYKKLTKDKDDLKDAAEAYIAARNALNEIDASLLDKEYIESQEDLDAFISKVNTLSDKTQEDREYMIELGKASYEAFKSLTGAASEYISQYDILENKLSSLESKLHDTSEMLGEMKTGKDILADATEEMEKNGEVSNDTVKALADMMEEGEDWLQYLKIENGQLKLNTELWKDRILSKLKDNIATLDDELVVLKQQNDELLSQLSLIETRNSLLSGAGKSNQSGIFGIAIDTDKSYRRNKNDFLPDNVFPGMLNNEYGQAWREQRAKESEIAEAEKRRNAYKAMYDSWESDIDSIISGEKELDEESRKTFNWIESMLDRIQRKVNEFSRIVGSKFKSLSTRNEAAKKEISAITEEIELQEKAYRKYIELCGSINLSDEIKKTIQNGAINISEYDEKTAELISQYQEWYEAALDTKDAVDELHESLASLYDNEFNRIQTDFENRISLLEYLSNMYNTGISQLETEGYMASTEFYNALTESTEHNIELLKEELNGLESAMQAALDSGEIEMYSEAWYGYVVTMNGVKEAIADANLSLAEFAKTMREINWEYFDYLQDSISNITDESEFLLDLLGEDNIFKDGKLTEDGLAALGLRAMDYNVYMAQADKYAEEILNIEQQLANDPYNKDLLERRGELLELQRESILAAEDEKDAILDLVHNAIEKQLDSLKELIDAYKKSLDAAKDLYDYRNKIADETSEISSLNKQIAAYQNDNSEETRATIQKLNSQLIKAQKELEETEYEKYIDDQKKLLDNLYAEYESLLNQRMDNTDALLSDIITMVNQNSSTINDTLRVTADSVGYTLSDSMQTIWGSSFNSLQGVVTTYGEGFLSQLTTTNQALNNIANLVSSMQSFSNSWAGGYIGGVNNSYTPDISGWVPSGGNNNYGNENNWGDIFIPDDPFPSYPSQNVSKPITVGGRINAAGATIYRRSDRSDGGTTQYYGNDPIYTVLSQQQNKFGETMLLVRHHSKTSGNTGWFKMSDVRAYKHGGLVDQTGLVWLDGTKQKPESVLNADDTQRFQTLVESMDKLASSGISFAGGSRASRIVNGLISGEHSGATSIHKPYGDFTQDVSISIPIEKVTDYDDFLEQLARDKNGKRLLQTLLLNDVTGRNSLDKYKYLQS